MSILAFAALAKDRLPILGGGIGAEVEGASLQQILRLAALFMIVGACVGFAAAPRTGHAPVPSDGVHAPAKR